MLDVVHISMVRCVVYYKVASMWYGNTVKRVHIILFLLFLWCFHISINLIFEVFASIVQRLKFPFPVMIQWSMLIKAWFFSMMQMFMVNVIISLLHMDNISANLMHCGSQGNDSKLSDPSSSENSCPTRSEEGNKMVISFTSLLLEILRQNIPSSVVELENTLDGGVNTDSRQALEWRMSISKSFIEEWEWRLSILQHLLPLSERKWRWKEALTVLRAAPSKLLNLSVFPSLSYI